MVLEDLGIERAALALDQLLGKVDHLLFRPDVRDVGEYRIALSQLFGITHGLEEQSSAAGPDGNQALLAAHRHLPDAGLRRGAQRLANDDVAFPCDVVGGNEIIGALEIARIDIAIVGD